jgi:hypothetical protein
MFAWQNHKDDASTVIASSTSNMDDL